MFDAFAPPKSDGPAPASTDAAAPAYQLFTPAHVGLATFLGSPLAGTVLVALNARRLGLSPGRPVGLALALFAAVFAVAMMLPVPGIVTTLAGVFGMRALAESEFGDALGLHTSRGGTTSPWWHAVLIGLAGMVVLLSTVMIGLVGLGATGALP